MAINELQRSFIRVCSPYYHQAVVEGKEDEFIASYVAMYQLRWPIKRGEIDNLALVLALEAELANNITISLKAERLYYPNLEPLSHWSFFVNTKYRDFIQEQNHVEGQLGIPPRVPGPRPPRANTQESSTHPKPAISPRRKHRHDPTATPQLRRILPTRRAKERDTRRA